MDVRENKEDVEKKVVDANNDKSTNPEPNGKKNKIAVFGVIGGVALVLIVALILILVNVGKISKDEASKLVKSYITAINDKDEEKYLSLIDTKGYIIYREDGEKKFKDKYKNKDKYISRYMDEKNYDDIDDVKSEIENDFKTKYKYLSNEYTFKEIKEITKSKKSNNIVIIKAKIKTKSKYSNSSDNNTLVLYTTKVNGKYKIIGEEIR